MKTLPLKPWEHIARGLCKSSGCLCSQKYCTAPSIYMDMAMAAALELENAGYVYLPPMEDIIDEAPARDHRAALQLSLAKLRS